MARVRTIPTPQDTASLARLVSHPLRVRILAALPEGADASPSELAAELGAPLGTVSYHMRFLAHNGALELTNTIPRRGALEHRYRFRDEVRRRLQPFLAS